MAETPSINPSQVSARNTEEGAVFDKVLFSTLDALEEAKIPFALIGGVATSGLGRPRSTHDIDIFLRPEDAELALRTLAKHGFRTEKFDIQWLFKGFQEEILVDLIFRSQGEFYYDDDIHSHRKFVDYHGRQVPVVAPEDLAIIKCAVHYEGGPHHWHDALAIISRNEIDWNYLLKRAKRASKRVLSLLLYAQSMDVLIPNHVVLQLFENIFGEDFRRSNVRQLHTYSPSSSHRQHNSPAQSTPTSGASTSHESAQGGSSGQGSKSPEYLIAHVREALAEDGRTAQQDLKVLISGNQIVVKGIAPSEASKSAIDEVIRKVSPEHEVVNQVSVSWVPGPEKVEEIS